MTNTTPVNSKDYWNHRFVSDWESREGRQQTVFFYQVALDNLPGWLVDEIRQRGLSVCDLGCAEGDGTHILTQFFSNSEVVGVDFSEEAIRKAASYYPECRFLCQSIEELEGSYDVYFASNILEHFEEPFNTILNVVGKNPAYIVVMVPFEEYDRIDEHLFTFTYDTVPLRVSQYQLIHAHEIDCNDMSITYWPGKQFLAIYQDPKRATTPAGSLNSVVGNLRKLSGHLERKVREFSEGLARKSENVRNLEAALKNEQEMSVVKENQLSMMRLEMAVSQAELASMKAQLASATAQLSAKQAEITAKDAEVSSKEAEISSKVAEITSKQAEITAKEAELSSRTAELSVRQVELRERLRSEQTLREDLRAKETAIAEMTERLAQFESANHELSATLEASQVAIREHQERSSDSEARLRQLGERVYASDSTVQQLTQELKLIHDSHFWKLASAYYKVRDNTEPFRTMFKFARHIRNRSATSPQDGSVTVSIRNDFGKLYRTWKSGGFRLVALKVRQKLSTPEVVPTGPEQVIDPKPPGINWYEYKFVNFKETYKSIFDVSLERMAVPCVQGLVTVVLPVYNGEDLIASSIESVLSQTYQHLELIVINDGSQDGTAAILNEYAGRDSRIVVVHQENRKIPRTLSRGFDIARGEFLTWTSADNIMHPTFVEEMVSQLQQAPNTAMVFGNMNLIDAQGDILREHGWYEEPKSSGIVKLPSSTRELNTYPNNTIGAAFMYRAIAQRILGKYSFVRHTLEDYDYWMRMNSLLTIQHTSFETPLYDYRWHDKSLTAQDKELGITASRYKLMILDDFRRDFYLSPMLWYVTSEDVRKVAEFQDFLRDKGQLVIDDHDMQSCPIDNLAVPMVHVHFCDAEGIAGFAQQTVARPGLFQVLVLGPSADGLVWEGSSDVLGQWDLVLSQGDFHNAEQLVEVRNLAWVDGMNSAFSVAAMVFMNHHAYRIEEYIETPETYDKKFSVIICTYRLTDRLVDAIKSVVHQSMDQRDYEIIVVNNDVTSSSICELVAEIRQDMGLEDEFLRCVNAPIKGLSYARNVGLYASTGEHLLYIDDDAVASSDLLIETLKAFDHRDNVGIVGGSIELDLPSHRPEVVLEGYESLWSQLIIQGESVKEVRHHSEFPYGANFAVLRDALKRVGGFRTSYGRHGSDFAGGEEIVTSYLVREAGYRVLLNPKSKVEHNVDPSRYSREHVRNTVRASLLTDYRLQKDLYAPMESDINHDLRRKRDLEAEIKLLKSATRSSQTEYQIFYKEAYLAAIEELIQKKEQDMRIMRSYHEKEAGR